MSLTRTLMLLALTACNQFFDLSETAGPAPPAPPDSDGDGDDDVVDNCVLIANGDQANADGDALGDLCDPCRDGTQSGTDADGDGVDDECDPCTSGSNHNEDTDSLLDGCDNCPGITNEDQSNMDGDDVGDLCDPTPANMTTPTRRVFFDSFAPPDPGWVPGFTTWQRVGDSYAPAAPSMAQIGPWNAAGAVDGFNWQITASITTATPSDLLLGISSISDNGDTRGPSCGLFYATSGTWYDDSAMPLAVMFPLVVKVRASRNPSNPSIRIRCSYGTTTVVSPSDAQPLRYYPELRVQNGLAEIQWIDVVQ